MLNLIPRDHWRYEVGDVFSALKASLEPAQPGSTLQLPGIGESIPVRSGRAALVTAIRALNLPPGAKIGVPLYCCAVVFRAIERAGCVPEFLDVDESTFCLSAQNVAEKKASLAAVIAVHMFGNACDIRSLQAVAQNIPLIEDCAQSLGTRSEAGPAGAQGDIAVFSFRSGKYLSVGEGGALFSASPELRKRAANLANGLEPASSLQEWLHVCKTFLKSLLRSKPLYGLVGFRLWEGLSRKLNLSAKSDISLRQIYKSDLDLVQKRLPSVGSLIQAHRANAERFDRELELPAQMLSHETRGSFFNRLQYPVTFPSKACRDSVAASLLARGVDTIKYLDDIVATATDLYGYKGGCPISEQLSQRVLILPNYAALRPRDMTHIISSVNETWHELVSAGGLPHLVHRTDDEYPFPTEGVLEASSAPRPAALPQSNR